MIKVMLKACLQTPYINYNLKFYKLHMPLCKYYNFLTFSWKKKIISKPSNAPPENNRMNWEAPISCGTDGNYFFMFLCVSFALFTAYTS